MPRTARELSSTGLYHVIMRGINQEHIFKETSFKHKIIQIIKEKLEDTSVEIYGYCIMDNHIHIILKSNVNDFSYFMAKVNISYAIYYNYVNKRSGYVFQNRFKSYPIENEKYFWTCLRYIHNNPIKAKMVKYPDLYKWSSYRGFISCTDLLLSNKGYKLMKNNFANKKSFIEFHLELDHAIYPDINEDVIIIKNLIAEHIWKITLNNYNLSNFLELYTNKLAMKYLRTELKDKAEFNNRQIQEFILKQENKTGDGG